MRHNQQQPRDAVEGIAASSGEQGSTFGARRSTGRAGQGRVPGRQAMEAFVTVFTIFVLAMFVGFAVITKVPPLLHTPLMSGSNAISGISIIGALLSIATPSRLSTALGVVALVLATINVVGGFLVTHRMLGMFKKRA